MSGKVWGEGEENFNKIFCSRNVNKVDMSAHKKRNKSTK